MFETLLQFLKFTFTFHCESKKKKEKKNKRFLFTSISPKCPYKNFIYKIITNRIYTAEDRFIPKEQTSLVPLSIHSVSGTLNFSGREK